MSDNETKEIINVSNEVESLVKKADGAGTADDALKYSQAACNAANAMSALGYLARGKPKERQGK